MNKIKTPSVKNPSLSSEKKKAVIHQKSKTAIHTPLIAKQEQEKEK